MKAKDENQETACQKFKGFFSTLNFEDNDIHKIDFSDELQDSEFKFVGLKIYPENTEIQFENKKISSESKIFEEKNQVQIFGKSANQWNFMGEVNLSQQNKVIEINFEERPCKNLILKSNKNTVTVLCLVQKLLQNDKQKKEGGSEKNVKITKEFSINDLFENTDLQQLKSQNLVFQNKNSSLEKFLGQIRQVFYNSDPGNLQQSNLKKELSDINSFLLENQTFRKEKLPESYFVFYKSNELQFQSIMNALHQAQSQLNSLIILEFMKFFLLLGASFEQFCSYENKFCFLVAGIYPQFFKKCKSKIQTKYLYKLRAERYLQKTEDINFYLYDYYLYFSEQSNLLGNVLNKQIQAVLQINNFFKEIKESLQNFLKYKIFKQKYLQDCPGADVNGLINQKIKNKKKEQEVYFYIFNFTVKLKKNLLNIQETCKQLFETIKNEKKQKKQLQAKTILEVYLQNKFFELKFEYFFKLLENESFLLTTKMIKCSITYILDLFKLLTSNTYQLRKKQQFLNEIQNINILKEERQPDLKFINNEILKYEKLLQFKIMIKQIRKNDPQNTLRFLTFLIKSHDILQFTKSYYKSLLKLFFRQIEQDNLDYDIINHIQYILLNQNKVNLVEWIFKNLQDYNITKLISAFQNLELFSNKGQKSKPDSKNIYNETTQFNMRETKKPIIIELFIFIKTITFQNMQNQQRLQKFDLLLQNQIIIIQQNQKLPYEYFRKNEAKLTNQEFETFENLIKKQNSINQNQFWHQFLQMSSKITQFDDSYDILFLQAFVCYFTQKKVFVQQVSISENQNFVTMIYNIFIFCSNYLNLYLGTSNLYQNYFKFQAIRQFIKLIEFCVDFLYEKHPMQKLENSYLINAIFRVSVIFYNIQDVGVRKGTINETKDDQSIFIKKIKSTTDKLEYICYKHVEVQSLFLGFSRTFFEGCNLSYLLEFLCKIYSQADAGDYKPLTDFFMINNIQKVTLLNLMYQDDLTNFFSKFNNRQNNFIMFIIQIIWSFSLEEFEINKHLTYRFLDQILSNQIQKLYQVISNFYSLSLQKNQEKIKDINVSSSSDKNNDKKPVLDQEKKSFENLKRMHFTLCMLLQSLCNPVFKSYFVNQKKTEALISLMEHLFLDKEYQKQQTQFQHLCEMINVNLLNCIQVCVNHKFGIRSLIKAQKGESLEEIQMVEDMPIEKHIMKIFNILIKIDYDQVQNEDLMHKLIELFTLLTDNFNGKNILMSLRQKNQQQNLFETMMNKIQNPKIWLSFIRFVLNFMEKPKKILNLQLMTYLLNVPKNSKDETHINKLVEFFEKLQNKNQVIKDQNSQRFLQIRIDYAFDIIQKAIEKISSKKQKFQKYFKKKIKTNYIDLLPQDMDKRLELLQKELGIQKNENKELDVMVKDKNFKDLCSKIIRLFKQQNIEELGQYFYNIPSQNEEIEILSQQYKFKIKLHKYPKVEPYWKFQYKPIEFHPNQKVNEPLSKTNYKNTQKIQPVQKSIQQKQFEINQFQNKVEDKKEQNQQVQDIQNQYSQIDDQQVYRNQHPQEQNLNLNNPQTHLPYIQQQDMLNYQHQNNYAPIPDQVYQQEYNNYDQYQNAYVDPQNYNQHYIVHDQNQAQIPVTQQYEPYQGQLDQQIPENLYQQQYYIDQDVHQQQQYNNQLQQTQYFDPNMIYQNQYQQPQYMFDPVTQQYYYVHQHPQNEYNMNQNRNNFIDQNQSEAIYNAELDKYYTNEDEQLKDVEFSDGEEQNQTNQQQQKQQFFDKFRSKK